MGKEKEHKSVRVARFLIVGVDGDKAAFAEAKQRWSELGFAVQRLTNDFYAHWLRLQIEAGGHKLIRTYVADTLAWHKADPKTRGAKPKCSVKAADNAMQKKLYRLLSDDHPEIHVRCLVLALHKLSQKLAMTPASNSAFPRWIRILDGCGEFPSSSRPLPIPFDTSNGSLLPPADEKRDFWRFQLRVDRIAREGKPATSTIDVLKIKTAGRKLHSLRHILWQIAKGEWKFCGSDLIKREDGWYVHLCYQIPKPEAAALDKAMVAVLRPGRICPVVMRINGHSERLGRRGKDVAYVRGLLASQRASKSEGFRSASSARKGHGRKRAMEWRGKLTRRWLDFVKTWNGQTAAAAVKTMVREGAGKLICIQPADAWRDTRFLANAGKNDRYRDSTGWDWYQMTSLLQRECEEFGVELAIRKHGERSFSGAKSTKSKARNAVAANQV